jgi:hypothetical protein
LEYKQRYSIMDSIVYSEENLFAFSNHYPIFLSQEVLYIL